MSGVTEYNQNYASNERKQTILQEKGTWSFWPQWIYVLFEDRTTWDLLQHSGPAQGCE